MTDTQTPEQRRDATVAAILAAGGQIITTTPLADPADTSTVVAYRIAAAATSYPERDALAAIQADTETDMTGLVPWVDPDAITYPTMPDGGA